MSLPCLRCPAQEPRLGDARSRRVTPSFPGDGRRERHTLDIHPSVLEIDGGILNHTTVRGFTKIPAATALFRRWPDGLEAANEEKARREAAERVCHQDVNVPVLVDGGNL